MPDKIDNEGDTMTEKSAITAGSANCQSATKSDGDNPPASASRPARVALRNY